MMRVLLIAILIFFFSSQVVWAKLKIRSYAKTHNWIITSTHPNGQRLATVCSIQSKKNNFFISYTGERGWAITFRYRKRLKRKTKTPRVTIYVDKKYRGNVEAYVDHKKKFLYVGLGLDTSILTPIFKGKSLFLDVEGDHFGISLAGLGRAYRKSLGCWRERMDSIPYVDDKTKKARNQAKLHQKKKQNYYETIQRLDLTTKTYNVASHLNNNLEGYSFFIKPNIDGQSAQGFHKSDLYLAGDEGKEVPVGNVVVFYVNQKRLSLAAINKSLNSDIAASMSHCEKTGVENRKPYFIGQTVEVHYRLMHCDAHKTNGLTDRIWLMQTDKYLLKANLILPRLISEQIEESKFALAIKGIAEELVK